MLSWARFWQSGLAAVDDGGWDDRGLNLMTQKMTVVALKPLWVLMLWPGSALPLWVTVFATFCPACVLLAQGLAKVPRRATRQARWPRIFWR